MRPCDCRDQQDVDSMYEQGIGINEWDFTVAPAVVEIEHRYYGKIKMPMTIFTKFAEWYLRDQKED